MTADGAAIGWIMFTPGFWAMVCRESARGQGAFDMERVVLRTVERLYSYEYTFERTHAETYDLGEAGA